LARRWGAVCCCVGGVEHWHVGADGVKLACITGLVPATSDRLRERSSNRFAVTTRSLFG
jgi:hypothetical protein